MSNQTEIKIENIRKATVNGRKVKLFDVRRKVKGDWRDGWLFLGTFSAPQRTPNRALLDHAEL